jgi:hypothetical protein
MGWILLQTFKVREPGLPSPALFCKGGEEKSPYICNFIIFLPEILDARTTPVRRFPDVLGF